jgi:hypothetical protein
VKKPEVDMIVGALPPPGKLKKGGPAEDAADGGADDAEESDYDPAEESAGAVAAALGIPAEKVDTKALADALRDFVKTA